MDSGQSARAGRIHPVTRLLRLPSWTSRVVALLLTVAALLPLLRQLPAVAVVTCFEPGHPLYSLVPSVESVHCITAPATVVSWTLMVGATLAVQLVLLPLALLGAGLLLRGARELAGFGRRLLALVFAWLDGVAQLGWRPAPVPVRVGAATRGWSRTNPRRGPPCC